MILAIDPGLNAMGWALFDRHRLLKCGLIRGAKKRGGNPAIDMPKKLMSVIEAPTIHKVVIEVPQVYTPRKSKGGPAALMDLTMQAGGILGMLQHAEPMRVTPHRWKGSIPKEVSHARVVKILSPSERLRLGHCLLDIPAGLRHNVYDAVGIGLHGCRRSLYKESRC